MGNKKNIIYLILGIGLGIIITNILHSAYPKVEFAELDENTIIERARDLGMVSIKESIKVEKGTGEIKDTELDKTLEKLEEALKRLENAEKTQIKELEENIEEEKEVVIKSGSNLVQVSRLLYDADLIDDMDEFIEFVVGENLSRKIITGRYKIKNNSSYSDIIHILTDRKPLNK